MKKIIAITLVMIFILLVGCNNKKDPQEEFFEDYSYYTKERTEAIGWDWFDIEEFNKMLEDHVFYKSSFNEVKKEMEGKERVVIYFGYKPELYQCPYCAAALPILNEAAKECNVQKILYLDIFEIRKNDTAEYKWLKEFIVKQIPDFGDVIKVPDIFVIENGKIIDHHLATLSYTNEDGTTGFLKGMTEEEKEQLKQIYVKMFNK